MRDGKRQKTTSFRHLLLCCYCRYILEVFEHDKFRPGTASLWLQCCRELVLTYVQEARVDVSMVLPVVSVATLVTVAAFWLFDSLVLENLVNILRRRTFENSGGHKWQTNGEEMANTSQNGQQIHRCHRCHTIDHDPWSRQPSPSCSRGSNTFPNGLSGFQFNFRGPFEGSKSSP